MKIIIMTYLAIALINYLSHLYYQMKYKDEFFEKSGRAPLFRYKTAITIIISLLWPWCLIADNDNIYK